MFGSELSVAASTVGEDVSAHRASSLIATIGHDGLSRLKAHIGRKPVVRCTPARNVGLVCRPTVTADPQWVPRHSGNTLEGAGVSAQFEAVAHFAFVCLVVGNRHMNTIYNDCARGKSS